MRFGRVHASLYVIILTILAVVFPVSGQVTSRPVYLDPIPVPPVTELTITVGYGHGLRAVNDRRLLNGQVALGFGRVRIRAVAGALMVDGDGQDPNTAWGADVAWHLNDTPKFPVISLVGGIGHHAINDTVTGDLKQIDFPLAIGLGVNAPLPRGVTVRLWCGPRLHVRYTSLDFDQLNSSAWKAGGGFSIGAGFRLPSELMAQLAADWLVIGDSVGLNTRHEVTIGFTVGYRLSI